MQALRRAGKLCGNVALRSGPLRLFKQMSTDEPSDRVYEIGFYQMKPDKFRESVDLVYKYQQVRTSHSKAVGSWKTEIGGICESIYLWEYDGLKQRMTRRKQVAEDEVLLPKFYENSLKLTSVLTCLAPGSSLITDVSPCDTAIYELQRCEPYTPLIQRKEGETMIGHFITVYGPVSSEYILIRYTDPDLAFNRAYDRRRTQGAKGYSRFLVPCEWSALK